MSNKKEIEQLIREFVLLELDDAPERKTNDSKLLSDDSLDLAIDRSIGNFEKDAKGEDDLDLDKFVSSINTFVEHAEDQLDIRGIIVRRVANFITKSYDEKMSQEVLRMLEDTFGLSADPSYHQSEPELSSVPVAKNGGPDVAGGAPPA